MGSDLAASAWGLIRLAGLAMLLGFVTVIGGAVLWSTANGGSVPGTVRHVWERGLIIAAIVLTAVGFLLLARHVRASAGFGLVLAGSVVYSIAGIVGVVGETANLSSRFSLPYLATVLYVVPAFLGQATVGLGLTRIPDFPAAVGWVALAWNLGWLAILPVVSPGDLYFPILHHMIPLLIAIPLISYR